MPQVLARDAQVSPSCAVTMRLQVEAALAGDSARLMRERRPSGESSNLLKDRRGKAMAKDDLGAVQGGPRRTAHRKKGCRSRRGTSTRKQRLSRCLPCPFSLFLLAPFESPQRHIWSEPASPVLQPLSAACRDKQAFSSAWDHFARPGNWMGCPVRGRKKGQTCLASGAGSYPSRKVFPGRWQPTRR